MCVEVREGAYQLWWEAVLEVLENGSGDASRSESCELDVVIDAERSELFGVQVLDLSDVVEAGALQVLKQHVVRKSEVVEHVLHVQSPLANEITSIM